MPRKADERPDLIETVQSGVGKKIHYHKCAVSVVSRMWDYPVDPGGEPALRACDNSHRPRDTADFEPVCNACVARPVYKPEIKKQIKAREALDKEWNRL